MCNVLNFGVPSQSNPAAVAVLRAEPRPAQLQPSLTFICCLLIYCMAVEVIAKVIAKLLLSMHLATGLLCSCVCVCVQ